VAVAAAACFGPATAAVRDPHQSEVTVHVAVERKKPLPDAPPRAGRLPPITPGLVAGWELETGLGPADFEVLSDSQPTQLVSCARAAGPTSIVLVVDVTASIESAAPHCVPPLLPRTKFGWLADQVNRALIPALDPGDRLAIGRIGGGLHFTRSWSSDPAALERAATELLRPTSRDEDRPFGVGPTPIWDAVDEAIGMLEPLPGRRGIVLVTDGRSSANVHGLGYVIAHALAAEVSVNVISSSREDTIRQAAALAARVRPRVLLEQLAQNTGGVYIPAYGPPPNPWLRDDESFKRWLGCTLARAVQELHGGYVLAFTPPVRDGWAHALTVRVNDKALKVRAPVAYRARPGGR
jgi:hypothetical protein